MADVGGFGFVQLSIRGSQTLLTFLVDLEFDI